MSNPFLKTALLAAILLASSGLTLAAQTGPAAAKPAKPAVTEVDPDAPRPTPKRKSTGPAKPKAKRIPESKLVNINGATKEELMKLPGINDLYAGRIIAGRPYLTKARLVTNAVLPDGLYAGIRQLIIAKQPQQK
jgi:DNA uptake protein ComE-like DNA-binding protein